MCDKQQLIRFWWWKKEEI